MKSRQRRQFPLDHLRRHILFDPDPTTPLVEAQGLVIGPDGILYLVVDPEAAAQHSGLPATAHGAATARQE